MKNPGRAKKLQLRQWAERNPSTLCWFCKAPARSGDPWQVAKDDTGAMRIMHRACLLGPFVRRHLEPSEKPSEKPTPSREW